MQKILFLGLFTFSVATPAVALERGEFEPSYRFECQAYFGDSAAWIMSEPGKNLPLQEGYLGETGDRGFPISAYEDSTQSVVTKSVPVKIKIEKLVLLKEKRIACGAIRHKEKVWSSSQSQRYAAFYTIDAASTDFVSIDGPPLSQIKVWGICSQVISTKCNYDDEERK